MEANFAVYKLLELVFYDKICFSRPDLDENKPANGKCLAKKRER